MKSQLSNSLKLAKLLPVCIFLSVSFHCFADTYVTLYTSNCTTTPNSITFDVYIVNNGSTTLGWSDGSLQFTIDSTVFESYNITDDCTLAYVDGTSDFPLAYSSDGGHSEKYSASTRTIKIKLVSGYYEESLDNVVSLPENLPRRIGRYILTNTTQNFVTGASVNLTWIDDSYTYAGCTATGTNLTHYFAGSSTRSLTTPCSMTIASCAAATLSSSITNISCHGKNDGAIDLTASGGTSPLTYSWTKDADASFSASTEDISGLDAGTYNVTVSTTGDTCSASASYTITEPSALDTITTKVSACDSYTWDIDNTAYTSSGIYDTTIDCQPYKLNLTITGSTTDTTTASACGSYTWGVNGTTYTSGGTYMYINGCSTKVLNLTIYNSRPDMPGSISGTKFNLCNASEGICSVTATSDAASYTWAPISGGLSISSGNGTNSIT